MDVISQPRYLPALNYIQRLYFSNKFIFLDNVQRQARGWENRNKINLNGKLQWLTIPITSSSRININEAKVKDFEWLEKHKNLLFVAYKEAPFFDEKYIEQYYNITKESFFFCNIIKELIINCCDIFDFRPHIMLASDIMKNNLINITGAEKLLYLCEMVGSHVYVSGPNGMGYGVKEVFNNKVKVLFHKFNHPEYKQSRLNEFTPFLSFFDALFNLGINKVKDIVQTAPEFF